MRCRVVSLNSKILGVKSQRGIWTQGFCFVMFCYKWYDIRFVLTKQDYFQGFSDEQNQCENKVWSQRLASLEIQSSKERKSN